jgi:hypothetical protein
MSEELEKMKGQTIKQVDGLEKYSEQVSIKMNSGECFVFYHSQSCCETVQLEDFDLEAEELEGAIVLDAYLETNSEDSTGIEYPNSFTWSFYRIVTNKGTLCMRWLGKSNGYYSEEVDIKIIKMANLADYRRGC